MRNIKVMSDIFNANIISTYVIDESQKQNKTPITILTDMQN